MGMFDTEKKKSDHSDHRSYSGTGNGSADSSVSDRIINFRRKRMRLGQAAMEALRAEIPDA